jgi:hypothetical protein
MAVQMACCWATVAWQQAFFFNAAAYKKNQMTCVRHPFDIVFYLWIT